MVYEGGAEDVLWRVTCEDGAEGEGGVVECMSMGFGWAEACGGE